MSARSVIITAAVITEGLLVIVSYVVAGLLDISISLTATQSQLAWGCVATLPLLAANEVMWRLCGRYPDTVFARFSREIVVPLCKQVTPGVAVLLACLSGFGEELLFRGVLDTVMTNEFGAAVSAIATSVLFAYVHFIGQLKRFGMMLPLYTAVGCYLWFVRHQVGSLPAAMVCHGLYNLIVILTVRARVAGSSRHAGSVASRL